MIRVSKRVTAPSVLVSKGVPATAAHVVLVAGGAKQLVFDRAIYHAPDVFSALTEDQHGKCCFCESMFLHVAFGDVEHFRPKAGWRQSPKGPLRQPGYYWLAYQWSNLHLSCEICNRRFKGNLFPVVRGTRASDLASLPSEIPTFVDPAADDPEIHVGFRGHLPLGKTARGRATIRALGLRRKELREHRMRRLAELRGLADVMEIARLSNDPDLVRLGRRARRELRRATLAKAEYASMARCFVAGLGGMGGSPWP